MVQSSADPIPSTLPDHQYDGTIVASLCSSVAHLANGYTVELQLPRTEAKKIELGHFFLARRTAVDQHVRYDEWTPYGRLPLTVVSVEQGANTESAYATVTFFLTHSTYAAEEWTSSLQVGTKVNLIGPLGKPVKIPTTVKTLLIIAPYNKVMMFRIAIEKVLDTGGRVSFLALQTVPSRRDDEVLRNLPIAVEVQEIDSVTAQSEHLVSPIRWADMLLLSLDSNDTMLLCDIIAHARFQLDANFAYVLVESDLVCGFGGCLTCVVSTRFGRRTRACIHGPLMDIMLLYD